MENKASSFEAMLAALPSVQEQVRNDIAARIEAGEEIAGRDYREDILSGLDRILDALAKDFPEVQIPRLREDEAKKSAA